MKIVLLPGLDGTGNLFEPFLNTLVRSHDVRGNAYEGLVINSHLASIKN